MISAPGSPAVGGSSAPSWTCQWQSSTAGESATHASGADMLSDAIAKAARAIRTAGARDEISRIMTQEASEQTDAMAALTLAGALSFHDMAAESKPEKGIRRIGNVVFGNVADVAALLDAWESILDVNYFPIFGPAKEILANLPSDKAPHIMGELHAANSRMRAMGLNNSPDLHGQVFQRLIADRKKLAAFYTKPAAAALLAAVTVPDRVGRRKVGQRRPHSRLCVRHRSAAGRIQEDIGKLRGGDRRLDARAAPAHDGPGADRG